ncbi:MAG TPA: hypothetical protein PKG48_09695 [Bacteroidales bacterium]|nr:hypothetical protein [Bacteroidales bacterium]HPS63740.1 hypothetical protein [Bacteroidales bacterium]
MKTTHRLDKSFGPAGSFAGLILFIAGILLTCFHFSGVLLILIGGFVGFTNTSAIVDSEKKRVKFSNNLFGILPTGKWIQIQPGMKLGIKEYNQTYSAYSQGNRKLDVSRQDFRILLYNADGKEFMQIARADSLDAAKAERDASGIQLGLKEAAPSGS